MRNENEPQSPHKPGLYFESPGAQVALKAMKDSTESAQNQANEYHGHSLQEVMVGMERYQKHGIGVWCALFQPMGEYGSGLYSSIKDGRLCDYSPKPPIEGHSGATILLRDCENYKAFWTTSKEWLEDFIRDYNLPPDYRWAWRVEDGWVIMAKTGNAPITVRAVGEHLPVNPPLYPPIDIS